jgi:transposase-like protein
MHRFETHADTRSDRFLVRVRGEQPYAARDVSRPTKLTGERRVIVLDALRSGEMRYRAARRAGIGRATLYRWIKRDCSFRRDVAKADARWERAAMAPLRRHFDEQQRRTLDRLLGLRT